jgi:FkbM family methyltransferase
MALKSLFNPVFYLAARTCEKSSLAAELIRKLDFKGKGSIIQRIRPGSMCREVTAESNGIRYHLNLRDDIQRELYFNIYERHDLRTALELVPAGGICLDVGANNGAFALNFARKVGPQGRVHAFEPDEQVFSRLVANCHLNGFENVLKCHQFAVSNLTGRLSFFRSDRDHSGWGSLEQFTDIAVQTQAVDAITLDDFLANENIHNVDFLKVDVEAHEPEFLAGAKKSLSGKIFEFILIEFNGIRLAQRGKSLEDFLQPLTSTGYSPVKLRLELLQKMRNGVIAPETVCTNFLFAAQA